MGKAELQPAKAGCGCPFTPLQSCKTYKFLKMLPDFFIAMQNTKAFLDSIHHLLVKRC
jgi:hypothetical protein